MMWSIACLSAALCFTLATAAEDLPDWQQDDAIVIDGAWRFTAVTDRLIRIEYDEARRFLDEPTIVFLRKKPIGRWHKRPLAPAVLINDTAVLSTDRVSVRYTRDRPPSAETLSVISIDGKSTWSWGDDPSVGNLRGTARTLDSGAETLDLNCHHKVSPTMDNSEMHCAWGLVSKLGWAVVNDTGAPVRRNGWYASSRNTVDISIFMHDLDFMGALQDFFYAAGSPALPPRYAFGTMFTRWFDFDSDKVMSLVDDFEARSMPLDVWIFDMNWHIFGPWGSFTWNEDSYPRLQEMLDWMKARGMPIGANMHEHDGITTQEKTYKEVCAALGRTPGQNIPFDLYNKSFAMAQEDISVRALYTNGSKQGIDISWIDYQQGEVDSFEQTTIPNINPTIVLNELRSNFSVRRGENKRSMIVSRWGGLGSHRYPVGFSGDQLHSWKGLAFLPYFTSTAANVAFNYWSHDTVGGDGGSATDYELSARWTQTSAWSPVLRFHDKGQGTGDCATTNVCARIVPWDLPNDFYMAVRDAAQKREELVPYIYTAAFKGRSTGASLVRPMYYEEPADSKLYGLDHQYLFGPDMVISPITIPSGPEAQGFEKALGAVQWTVYAPQSAQGWVDRLNGNFAVAQNVTSTYGIFDVPGFLRQGAVIPMRPRTRGETSLARAVQPLQTIEFRIAPAEAFYTGGAIDGSGSVVDDDGLTLDYEGGAYSEIKCAYSFKGRVFKIQLSQAGDFKGRPQKISVKFSFPQLPPLTVNAKSNFGSSPSTTYDHQLLGTIISFADVDLSKSPYLEVTIDSAYEATVLTNFMGALGRVRRARYVKDAMDDANIHYGAMRAHLAAYVLAATHMSPAFAASLPDLWDGAMAQVGALLASDKTLKSDPRRSKFISTILEIESTVDAPKGVALVV